MVNRHYHPKSMTQWWGAMILDDTSKEDMDGGGARSSKPNLRFLPRTRNPRVEEVLKLHDNASKEEDEALRHQRRQP